MLLCRTGDSPTLIIQRAGEQSGENRWQFRNNYQVATYFHLLFTNPYPLFHRAVPSSNWWGLPMRSPCEYKKEMSP